ncbi:MAG: demethylmenaquinone methyltransferase, partial [Streptosporangiales bacterium]|nr:demethylmenaquinone methyltransferase [Streptosporangiales bacterium]
MSSDDLVARLSRLDSCAVSDALDVLGVRGVASGLFPVWEGARLVGRAVTVKLVPGVPPPDAPGVHLGVRAIERCGPGDVIVVDNGGRVDMGGWGGLLSLAASLKKISGVVVDGACR